MPSSCLPPHLSFLSPSTTQTHTLSLHDALPIFHTLYSHRAALRDVSPFAHHGPILAGHMGDATGRDVGLRHADRKSTRLNSSHTVISYAVFCLKKKKQQQ